MRSDKITNGSGAALVALTIMTNGYSVMHGSEAGCNAWVSHIIAAFVALLCAGCFASACEKYPDKSFYEVLTLSFRRLPGKVAAAVLALLSLITCVLSLTVFSRFVQITALPQTPQIIIPLLIIIIAALSLRRGLWAVSGSARLLLWFSAAVFVVFAVFGIRWMNFSFVVPTFEQPQKILVGAGEIFLNRFGAIPALMAIYVRMQKNNRRRFFISSILGAALALATISSVTVATLGTDTTAADFYPIYTAMSVRGIGGFIQHTEILACIVMTICLFFKSAVCLLFADDMLSGLFGTSRCEGTVMPLALISAAATQVIYRDISSLRGMVEWKSGAVYVVAVNIIIPVLLIMFVQKRKTKH